MFENFISLGHYCGVAASMSKLGLRSLSGPFDWYISGDFESVINCIENDFDGFLDKENLELLNAGLEFKNNRYSFYLGHEVKVSFEDEYDSIYSKYMRRIAAFRKQIKARTCFIRAVSNEYELDYIESNIPYIEAVIKKYNPENEIVYVIGNNVNRTRNLLPPFYKVDFSYAASNMKELRSLFDSNKGLIDYFVNNYDEKKRYKNMVFDLQKENASLEYRYYLMTRIDKMDLAEIDLPDEIVIYGAGAVGKHFYQRIKEKCGVAFFIDKSPKENVYDGIEIFRIGNPIDCSNEIPIIVTPCYEYVEIKEKLLNLYGEMNVISLEDLFR